MKIEGDAHLLRIFVGESDRWQGRPLYEAIVRVARDQGLFGATATRGIEGYGASNRIHTVKVLRLSEDLPIVIEIIDRPERIAAFIPTIDEMVSEGLVTIEKVRTIMYRHDAVDSPPVDDDELQLEDFEPVSETATSNETIPWTSQAEEIITAAKETAVNAHRVFIDSVDILLAMLCDPKGIAGQVLTQLGIDCRMVARALRDTVSRDESGSDFLVYLETKSIAEAKWLGHKHLSTDHLLLALCQIRPSAGTDILMRLGAQPRDICKEVLTILDHQDDWQRWLADHPDM